MDTLSKILPLCEEGDYVKCVEQQQGSGIFTQGRCYEVVTDPICDRLCVLNDKQDKRDYSNSKFEKYGTLGKELHKLLQTCTPGDMIQCVEALSDLYVTGKLYVVHSRWMTGYLKNVIFDEEDDPATASASEFVKVSTGSVQLDGVFYHPKDLLTWGAEMYAYTAEDVADLKGWHTELRLVAEVDKWTHEYHTGGPIIMEDVSEWIVMADPEPVPEIDFLELFTHDDPFFELPDLDGDEDGPVVSDGGSTSYYELPYHASELRHLISHKDMGFARGNIFKAAYRLGEKSGTDVIYDLNKMELFVQDMKEAYHLGKHI